MKTTAFSYLVFAGMILSFPACNPDCESGAAANISMLPEAILPAGEVLLRSTPADFLMERKVFISDPGGGANLRQLELTRWEDLLGGLVVTLPEDVTASANVFVEDPDCGGFLLIDPLQIRTEDFFYFSDVFVVPPAPFIFVPTPAVNPPTNITNAWITPYRRSYCIWFVPEIEVLPNGEKVEKSTLRPLRPTDDELGIMRGSHEFVVCGSIGEPERHLNANVNPVSGYVDKRNNDIMIRIDRTSKGLGVETFTGMFIIPGNQIPDTPEWRFGGSCGTRNREAKDFMLLTSQTTGQQVLMIKVNPD